MARIKKRTLSEDNKPAAQQGTTISKQNQNKKKKVDNAVTLQTKPLIPSKVQKLAAIPNGKDKVSLNPKKPSDKQEKNKKSNKVAASEAEKPPMQKLDIKKDTKQVSNEKGKGNVLKVPSKEKKNVPADIKTENDDSSEADPDKKAQNALANSKKKQRARELRKQKRIANGGRYVVGSITIEQLEAKIEDIKSRETLTKTAKRRLGVLKRKLHILQSGETSLNTSVDDSLQKKDNEAPTKKTEVKGKKQQEAKKSVDNQQKVNKAASAKDGKKNEQTKKLEKGKAKPQKQNMKAVRVEPEKDEDDVENESDDEEEEDEMQVDDSVDENDVDSDDNDNEDEEEDDDDDDADDDEDEDEDDEEEEEEEEEQTKVPHKQNSQQHSKKAESKNVQAVPEVQEGKSGKQRYVLFVGNLPYDVKPDSIKQHFLKKVSAVVSVRIPTKKGSTKPQGFAYVEFGNSQDYEKALTLHNTFIGERKINVQYTTTGSKHISKKQDVVAKNQKLHALRKAGKLVGSKPSKKFAKKKEKAST